MKHTSIFRKWIALLMSVVLLLVLPINAGADTQPRSDPYFQLYGITLSSTASGDLHMFFNVCAKRAVDMIGVSFYRVQRKVNGSWSNVTDIIEGYLETDSVICSFSRDFTEAVSGVEYRVYARLYILAYDGVVSTIDYYSQSFTMPQP